jgi:hypothetical protein
MPNEAESSLRYYQTRISHCIRIGCGLSLFLLLPNLIRFYHLDDRFGFWGMLLIDVFSLLTSLISVIAISTAVLWYVPKAAGEAMRLKRVHSVTPPPPPG